MERVVTPWHWQFPPIAERPKFLCRQLYHVVSEAREAESAEFQGEGNERIAEELMDAIHAAETALRMLPFDASQLDEIKRGVIEKNDRRGYYGGAE